MKSWKKVEDKNLKVLRGGQTLSEYALLLGGPLENGAITIVANVVEGRMPLDAGINAIEGMVHSL